MEENKGEEKMSVKKIASGCDVEALKKCLQQNKGDYVKCQSHIEAFKSSCSVKHPPLDNIFFYNKGWNFIRRIKTFCK